MNLTWHREVDTELPSRWALVDKTVLVLMAGTKRVADVTKAGGWRLVDVPVGYEGKVGGDNDGEHGGVGWANTIDDIIEAEHAYHELRLWKLKHRRRS